jgi:hypothetical protein
MLVRITRHKLAMNQNNEPYMNRRPPPSGHVVTTVARDMKEVGADGWDVSDIRALLAVFDRRVPLLEESRDAYTTQGNCKRCNASVLRWGAPVFRDSFVERAEVKAALPDVGAAANWPVPICGHVFQAAPSSVLRAERERIEQSFPRLNPSLWLEYMKAISNT